jgi:hypothetical protein
MDHIRRGQKLPIRYAVRLRRIRRDRLTATELGIFDADEAAAIDALPTDDEWSDGNDE